MIIPAIAIALFCTVNVAVAVLVSDVAKPSWAIGLDKRRHPFGFWSVVGAFAAIGAVAWLRVGGLI